MATALLLALTFTRPVAAAAGPASLVGETVRLELTNGQVLYGEVTVDSETSLIVHLEESAKPVKVDRETITKIEVGHHRSRGKKTLYGALIGLTVGVAWGYASGDDKPDPNRQGYYLTLTPTANDKAQILGALGVVAGAITGFVMGPGKQHWTDVTPRKPTMQVMPVATLHSIGVNGSVRW